MEAHDPRAEIAELRQWIDWLAWRIGELERQEAARQAHVAPLPVTPQPITEQPVAAQPVAAQPVAAQPAVSQPVTVQPVAAQPAHPHRPFAHHPAAPAPSQPRPSVSLEDLLSPERLAWAGGAMLVAGIAFLVSWGIHKGWITPTMRIAGAAVGCVGLAIGAVFMRRRGDKGVVPHALAAVSIAGLYATLVAATLRYDMVGPPAVQLALAAVIAAAGVMLAFIWDSEMLGGLALCGALLTPGFVDAPHGTQSLAFILIAYAATMALSAKRDWRWLATAAITLTMMQAPLHLSEVDSIGAQIAGWTLIWAITQLGAFARIDDAAGKVAYAITLFISTAVIAGAGADFIADSNVNVANAWVAVLAGAHSLMALANTRLRRMPELDWILACILATIAAALIVGGVALVACWCALAAAIAWQTHESRPPSSRILARIGAGALLALAVMKVIDATDADSLLERSFQTLSSSEMLAIAGATMSVLAAALIWMWREQPSRRGDVGAELIPLAAAIWAPAWLMTVLLDGSAVVVALCAIAAIWQIVGRSAFGVSGAIASYVLLAAAAVHTLVHEAPPDEMLSSGTMAIENAAVSLVAITAGLLTHTRGTGRDERTAAFGLAALSLVYLGSGVIIYLFSPVSVVTHFGTETIGGTGQTGQALLSAFWALVAFTAVVAGLRLRVKEIRIAGLSLLIVAVVKILVFDLANLDAAYRTISFIVTGAVLVAAALAFQRLRRDDPGNGPPAVPGAND